MQVELSGGTIEYEDTGGSGPVLVLLHGLLMDGSLWDDVVADLSADHRCLVPTLPLGAHRIPMKPEADLSLMGISQLVTELLERLDLRDVTLVGNDTGGALAQLIAVHGKDRLSRVVLISCDAFDNFPPGLTGKVLFKVAILPVPLFGTFMQQMRLRPIRRLPIAFGWLTKRGDEATARWIKTLLRNRDVQRDTVRALRAFAADTHVLVDTAEQLADFDRPVLVIWADGDRVMPPQHGQRLAELLPQGEFATIDDSYTLIPLDQPSQLAQLLRSMHVSTQRAGGEYEPEQRRIR